MGELLEHHRRRGRRRRHLEIHVDILAREHISTLIPHLYTKFRSASAENSALAHGAIYGKFKIVVVFSGCDTFPGTMFQK